MASDEENESPDQSLSDKRDETTLPPQRKSDAENDPVNAAVGPATGASRPANWSQETATIPPTQWTTEAPDTSKNTQSGAKVRYFGDYELLEEIARGGMGVVYKARQLKLNRIVAVKMILAGQLADDNDIKRFYVEAEAAANLQHPNIVAIYEVGEHDGQHYFSMDFVDGRSLADIVRKQRVSPRQAAEYVKTIAETIHFAHQKGTLHRDLKPGNILIDQNNAPRVTDFGLAKRMEGNSKLTATGAILGTPSYMPPEQAAPKRGAVGPASDVYSLGAVLYELITGQPPFQADSPLDTLMQIIEAEPALPRSLNPTISRDLETICLKCLRKDAHDRYATAQELAGDLERFIRGDLIHARRVNFAVRTWRWYLKRPAVGTLGLGLLCGAVNLLLTGGQMQLDATQLVLVIPGFVLGLFRIDRSATMLILAPIGVTAAYLVNMFATGRASIWPIAGAMYFVISLTLVGSGFIVGFVVRYGYETIRSIMHRRAKPAARRT